MFRIDQIISAIQLRRDLYKITKYLRNSPQALLITQKSHPPLVLVNGEIFESLLHFKMEHDLRTDLNNPYDTSF